MNVLLTCAGRRNYLVLYQRRQGQRGVERPARWWVRSSAEAGQGDGFDLRNPKDAAALEKTLEGMDLRALTG